MQIKPSAFALVFLTENGYAGNGQTACHDRQPGIGFCRLKIHHGEHYHNGKDADSRNKFLFAHRVVSWQGNDYLFAQLYKNLSAA